MIDAITVLTSFFPDKVCKTYAVVNGMLKKHAVANVIKAKAKMVPVETAADLVTVLREVTESQNQVIVPGRWIDGDEPFDVITENELVKLVGVKGQKIEGGVHVINGRRVAARLKRSIINSGWTLFDADDPEGMPLEWRGMPVAQRLEMFEAILPGISKCERVELRSSSARVSDKAAFGGASHAYIRLSDPAKLEVLRTHVTVEMVLRGLSFPSPRHSRTEPGKVIGHAQRTVFDTAVWVPGRLIFCAKPDISQAPGYQVADADIRIVNEGAGPLDVSWLEPPAAKRLVEYRRTTGVRMRLTKGEGGLSSTDYGQLTLETEITVKGVAKPLKAWLVDMKSEDKLRCEAPFRASESEAGVIFVMQNGKPCVYDVGTSTTHHLADAPMKADFEELVAEAKRLTAEDTDAIAEVASMAAKLKPVPRETVLKTLKAATGMSLTVLRQQASAADDDDGGGDDQLALARRTIETIGSENIIFADAVFWMWDGTKGVWVRCDDKAVKQIAQGVVVDAGQEVTSALINGVTEVLSNTIYVDGHEFNLGNPETVNCPNGELELVGGKWVLQKHRRELYRTTQIPVGYDAAADAPLFRAFLGQVFRDDDDKDDKVQAVLELMGYTLMSHARHEMFVMLIGSGANGKSVLLAVLEALCGAENTAGVQPANFDRSFQRAHLHMKLANIVTEINQGEVMADAELKGIVSGEASTVEHKFKNPFTMRPFATCWFGTNHMPHTRDNSNAIFRRAMILTFNRTFVKGEQDPQLKDKLITELPGILKLCLAAYAKALQDGFTRPASSEAAKNEWKLETDQVAQFVEEACTRETDSREKSSEVFKHYKSWVELNGIKLAVTHKTLRDRLTHLGFGKQKTRECAWVVGLKLNGVIWADGG
jgi:putative DNA primase/helicase